MPTPVEEWEENFAYQRVRHLIQQKFDRPVLPDLNALLFLIGVQELGRWKQDFSKEEKQDLMHIAVCRLMSYDGHYTFVGRDDEGWPHYRLESKIPPQDLPGQESLLKEKIVRYFNELEEEEGLLG
ncbi:hypothetical protein QWY85_02910 [Neolewinella lacunae]|uniref:hypothetical protein n=1 Tax=Neolewinella lacunae TaxID=1517758 RepID=UPI001CA43AB8|nr:hypothetical protein [Neolewinella lacunae]MDN3633589.1 hypothetical protein [Neolewinella lacunae]